MIIAFVSSIKFDKMVLMIPPKSPPTYAFIFKYFKQQYCNIEFKIFL